MCTVCGCGDGNVVGLDVLRAMTREPDTIPALLAEVEPARGNDANLDRAIDDLKNDLADTDEIESRMRSITEAMALTLQGALLTRDAPSAVAEAFCASRLAPRYRGAFGADLHLHLERLFLGGGVDPGR